jgi:SecD/SecF fusion protein
MTRHLGWRLLAVLAVIGGAAALIASRPMRLGLDLRGGTQIVLQAKETVEHTIDADTVNRTLEVLRRRVDQLGVSEPVLQKAGSDRIIVELPGVSDPREAVDVIGKTAQLSFHAVLGAQASPQPTPSNADGELVLADEAGLYLRLAPSSLTGDAVRDARAEPDTQSFGWSVVLEFRGGGARDWESLTGRAACEPAGDPKRRVAIVLDDRVISSPQVSPEIGCNQGISGGSTVITGNFTDREAKDLALLIRAGALPVPVQIVEQRTVGPTLGKEAIEASTRAALIGASLTILYIIVYYRLLGVLAALALAAYGAVSFAVLLALGSTLTLPGIAGFVLAIGMAVDANVLVFERMKEEFAGGARVPVAGLNGFKRAWSAIVDSNATTLIAAFLLFYFAAGAVRGFGVTLTVGVAVSMFTALVVTRAMVDALLRSRVVAGRPGLLGLRVGERLRTRLATSKPQLLRRSRLWLALSAAVVGIAVAGIATRGLTYGLEFTGGRLVEYSTARTVEVDAARTALTAAGFPRATVNESGAGNISVRTTALTDDQEQEVEAALSRLAGSVEKVRDEFVGPTIGGELRRKALIALGLALAAQLAYMAIRFRWTFAAAAVTTMFHDVIILVGVFAWLGKTFDGVFLAAMLTVVGYSVNDSVVIFDRIREERRIRSREPLAGIANDACLQTIPRTINTGLGALFILVALWALGGETLADFALALLAGILIGTYSSVFTATPLALELEVLSPSVPTPKSRGSRTRSARPSPSGRGRRPQAHR